MFYQISKAVKTQLILALRESFTQSTTYMYSDDDEKTRIFIGDIYSYGALFENNEQPMKLLPAILISMSSSTNYEWNTSQIQGEMRDINGNAIAQTFGGGVDGSYNVMIAAESTIEREELTDLVFLIFTYLSRSVLLNRGVLVRKISVGGDQEEPYSNDYIYTSNITLETYTEWGELVGVDTIEKVIVDVETFYNNVKGTPQQ